MVYFELYGYAVFIRNHGLDGRGFVVRAYYENNHSAIATQKGFFVYTSAFHVLNLFLLLTLSNCGYGIWKKLRVP